MVDRALSIRTIIGWEEISLEAYWLVFIEYRFCLRMEIQELTAL